MATLEIPFPADLRPSADLTDADLVRKTLAGCRPAFDELIVRYQRQALAVAYRLLGNVHDALEITQDAFFKAFSNLSTLQHADAFGGWLMRIVSNLSLNFRRARNSRATVSLDDFPTSSHLRVIPHMSATDPAHLIESIEMGGVLRSALDDLPVKQRSALTLFSIDEKPQRQVAHLMGCSVEAVKWHVFQGRRKLRERLGEYF